MDDVLDRLQMPPLEVYDRPHCARDETYSAPPRESNPIPNAPVASDPMGTLYEVTQLRSLRKEDNGSLRVMKADDFISRGLIRIAEARELFQMYHSNMDHYIYGIASKYSDLEVARNTSTLLTLCICTIAALHHPSKTNAFNICYSEFLSQVGSTIFSKPHSLTDILALAIGAFYLPDVSWVLSGLAIRLATEQRMYASFDQVMKGNAHEYERLRIWYLLYICDHHFSIAYGRPPSIYEQESIREWRRYLDHELHTDADMRMSTQVSLFVITSRIYDTFGTDVTQPLSRNDISRLRQFNEELDIWLGIWGNRLPTNAIIGDFPKKALPLHGLFAKLYLCSHVFRGEQVDPEFLQFADIAVSSATDILTIVIEEPLMHRALVGVPLYVHTMIAFAAVFLLKVATTYRHIVSINTDLILHLLTMTSQIFNQASAARQHILYYIADGLDKMIKKVHENQGEMSLEEHLFRTNPISMGDLENFDFLSHQQSGFDIWSPNA